jgi:hypothetical protein
VIMCGVTSEAAQHARDQHPGSQYFPPAHFDGHPSVLRRASRFGEHTEQHLTVVTQDAGLARASRARAAAWLDAQVRE